MSIADGEETEPSEPEWAILHESVWDCPCCWTEALERVKEPNDE